MNFADRCAIASACLPKSDYRAKLEALHAEMLAALETAQRDAERYRFLRADFSVMGANIDGNHSWAYRRNFSLRGPTLDAAIDEAMKDQP